MGIQEKSEITIHNEQRKRKLCEKVEPNPKTRKISEKNKNVRISNNMRDAVKTTCQVCFAKVSFVTMRSHTKSGHKLGISDYKMKHGELMEHIVEEVYHKCGICSDKIFFHGDAIAVHVKKHKVSHKEYNRKFINLLKDQVPSTLAKKEPKSQFDNMSSEELLAELDELI